MDIEAKRKRLEQLRAQREAKDRQVAELVEAKAPVPRTASTEDTDSPVAAASPVEAAPPAATTTNETTSSVVQSTTNQVISIVPSVAEVDIAPAPPPEKETYERSCLTDHVFVYNESRPHPDDVVANPSPIKPESGEGSPENASFANNQSFTNQSFDPATLQQMQNNKQADFGIKKMGVQQSAKVQQSQAFEDFLRNAGLVLSETLKNDTLTTLEAARGIEEETATAVELVQQRGSLIAPSVKEKVVTGLCYQPGSSDYFCASYANHETVASNMSADDGVEGTVLVWSTRRSHTHPVFVFTCPDEVSTVTYSPFHPQLIIGGTFSGRVILWDQRASAQPVVTSFPTTDSHAMSVFRAQVIGRETNNTLLTASVEGRVCTWPVDKPKYPLSGSTIVSSGTRKGRVAYSLAASEHEMGGSCKLHVGGADGTLYEGVHSSAASREGLDIRQVAKEHKGAVTSVDTHPLSGDSRFSGLTLTSSMDWTCRLWRGGNTASLDTFSDFVYDAKWSPTNPAVFAACDGGGCVSVWNLAESMDAPVASTTLIDSDTSSGRSAISVNKLCWNDAGDAIVAGGSQGECFALSVHHSLTTASNTQMERFAEVLNNTLVPPQSNQ